MYKVFTIYDSKAAAYLPRFIQTATGLALRQFEEATHRSDTPIGKHPADFTLFEVGTWDEQTDATTTLKAKINLGTALEIKEPLASVSDIHEAN